MFHFGVKKSDYIQIGWAGAAVVLHSTPDTIKGCYTEGLQTCICVVLIGEKGFLFVHDTLSLSKASIQKQCLALGKITDLRIFYNPEFYPGGLDDMVQNSRLAGRIGNILKWIDEIQGKITDSSFMDCSEAPWGFVSVIRISGGIQFDVEDKPFSLILPKQNELRHKINLVNWYFLRDFENDVEAVDVDIHFDGTNHLDVPALNKSREEVLAMQKLPKFSCQDKSLHIDTGEQSNDLTHFEATKQMLELYDRVTAKIKEQKSGSFQMPQLAGFFNKKPEQPKTESKGDFKKAEETKAPENVQQQRFVFFQKPEITKDDVVNTLKQITPEICQLGSSWDYKEKTKTAWIVAHEKNISHLVFICKHFQENNPDKHICNLHIEKTPEGQPILKFKLTEKKALEKIPIFQFAKSELVSHP